MDDKEYTLAIDRNDIEAFKLLVEANLSLINKRRTFDSDVSSISIVET